MRNNVFKNIRIFILGMLSFIGIRVFITKTFQKYYTQVWGWSVVVGNRQI